MDLRIGLFVASDTKNFEIHEQVVMMTQMMS